MLTRRIVAFSIATATLLVGTLPSLQAESPSKEWIRGALDHLQIRLHGEVVGSDGQPAHNIVVEGGINSSGVSHPLEPIVDGNQFELWIPVNEQRWYSMWLRAASEDGTFVQYKRLGMSELRQTAIDGIRLTLQPPTRELKVQVTQQGEAVPNAFVKTELGYGIAIHEQTDAEGIAVFRLLPSQQPSRFTAWTDDFRVGGFSFNRKPTRDPGADQHEVELSQCRDQKFRFIDQDGAPVPDVTFVLQMATMPNYNFIGTNENSRLTTDKNGELLYEWFPDWDQHHFYPDLQTNGWIRDGDPEMVDGVAVLKLKKGADRKQVTGRTVMQGGSDNQGFFVTLRSFQGERARQSDVLSGFSDTAGEFSFDVLPDSTYCAWTVDSKWVGEVDHLIPYQSASDTVTSPALTVRQGQAVKVIVTTGKSKKPYADLSIGFGREHRFTWEEDGRTRNGVGGPQWWATTNAEGVATTFALPGELKATIYTPLWRTKAAAEVTDDAEPTIIRLHREVDETQTVTGKLVLSEAIQANLEGARVKIGSVDGSTDDQQELVVQNDGSFSFETLAPKIGVFARTQDGKAAAAILVANFDAPIVLQLRPTIDYRGQLLGNDNQPLKAQDVWASVQLGGDADCFNLASFDTSFEAARIEAMTDALGYYTLKGLPSDVKIGIRTPSIDGSHGTRYLDEIYLQPGESRPVAVSQLGKKLNSVKDPLASRYEATLRDCSLMGFRMMMITSADDESTTEFIGKNFVNNRSNKNVTTFMQLVTSGSAESLPPADVAFLKQRKCPLPGPGRVFACAVDSRGNELGRLELNIAEEGAADKAAEFIHRYASDQLDADQKWSTAFDEAERSGRVVWARISQRYCGPCFLMARWLDDNKDLLAKDFVMLKIDNVRDKHGARVAERLTRGGQYGVPFHAIFDANQEVMIDSAGPLGNIGHPSEFEGKRHVRKMLLQTRQRLTDKEIDQIIDSLGD